VTDEGLQHLLDVPNLRELTIRNTRISATGLKKFRKAYPDVKIVAWSEPNREAAGAVLAAGGQVQIRIAGQAAEKTLVAGSDLPADDFRVVRIDVAGVKEGLGEVLARVAQLDDPAFDHLESLNLSGTTVGGDLATLKALPDLTELSLAGTKVSDVDLEVLKGYKKLQRLVLDRCPVRGAGLEPLKALPNLTILSLDCPTFTDLSIRRLLELKQLRRLSLAGSAVTGEGVKLLAGLANLEELDLTGVEASEGATADLQKGLPRCLIVGKPATSVVLAPDLHRRLAEWVLKQEDAAVMPEGSGYIQKAADLPQAPFRLASLKFTLANSDALSPEVAGWLRSLPAQTWLVIQLASRDWDDDALRKFVPVLKTIPNARLILVQPCRITDEGLKHLAGVSSLRQVVLSAVNVSDEGIRQLAKIKHLEDFCLFVEPATDRTVEAILARGTLHSVWLQYTLATPACLTSVLKNANLEFLAMIGVPLTDDDLQRLNKLKKLQILAIESPAVTSEGFRHLEALPKLRELRIDRCSKVDAGVFERLRRLENLTQLDLKNMKTITDESLQHVKTLPKLQTLGLGQCGVTAAGVAKLRAELPKLRVDWDGDKKQP
jgi:Leucine-rich repeat (LRR) protein